ncbi:hypothetical protein RBB50_011922 [Rhinocladiella similis]
MTFASAIAISIQVYVSSMRNAGRNIFEMTETFRTRLEEAQYLSKKLAGQESRFNEQLKQRVQTALERAAVPFGDAHVLLGQLDANRYDGKDRLWARAKFVLREDLLMQGMEKTESAMAALREVTNEALLDLQLLVFDLN